MCLIIYRPRPVTAKVEPITRAMLQNSKASGNDDSYGAMWAEGGKLFSWRGLSDSFDTFAQLVEDLSASAAPFALHMRYATHGKVTVENAHPFEVVPGLGMMHNGILTAWSPDNGRACDQSDTARLAETLRNFPRNWWLNRSLRFVLEEAIGYGNKLCILHESGRGFLVNEAAGKWEAGAWFSNDSHKSRSIVVWRDKDGTKRRGFDWGDESGAQWDDYQRGALPSAATEGTKGANVQGAKSARLSALAFAKDDREAVGACLIDGTIVCLDCVDETRGTGHDVTSIIFSDEIQRHRPLDCDVCGAALVEWLDDEDEDGAAVAEVEGLERAADVFLNRIRENEGSGN